MRLFFILLITALTACSSGTETTSEDLSITAQETVIYFSRHAEKDSGENPGLLSTGTARAERLAQRLANENISAVYATGYRRTQATAKPTADYFEKPIKQYPATGDPKQLTKKWITHNRGKAILVVGHSNTIPNYLNSLLRESRYREIDEDDYSNLFRVNIDKRGKATVKELSTD